MNPPPLNPGPPRKPSPAAGVAIAVLAVVLLGALVAGLVATVGTDDQSVFESSPTSTPGTSIPGTSTPGTSPRGGSPTTTAPVRSLETAITEGISFVEKTRGLAFKTSPIVTVVDDAAFTARFLELTERDIAEYAEEYAQATSVLQAVGLLPTTITYAEASRVFGAAGVLGFYDPETNELLVRGGSATPLVRTVIVHELTHALDDQWFELYRPELDDRTDEMSWAFTALAEGSARWVENQYRAQLTSAERSAADREELALSRGIPFQKVGIPFIQLQTLPYEAGLAFVEDMRANGGQPALDRVFTDLPESSEQVLRPEKYRKRERPTAVPEPTADGERIESGVVGEVVWRLLFDELATASRVERATDAWAGDSSVAWTSGSRSCLRADVRFDTSADADEFEAMARTWARTRPSGATEKRDASTVRVASCSA